MWCHVFWHATRLLYEPIGAGTLVDGSPRPASVTEHTILPGVHQKHTELKRTRIQHNKKKPSRKTRDQHQQHETIESNKKPMRTTRTHQKQQETIKIQTRTRKSKSDNTMFEFQKKG